MTTLIFVVLCVLFALLSIAQSRLTHEVQAQVDRAISLAEKWKSIALTNAEQRDRAVAIAKMALPNTTHCAPAPSGTETALPIQDCCCGHLVYHHHFPIDGQRGPCGVCACPRYVPAPLETE
jgi:hypothetical protein